MIYPKSIEKEQTVGICAPSAGAGSKIEALEESEQVLRELGYRVKETASVRKDAPRSTGPRKRAKELDELIRDPEVRLVLAAAGGDFMLEMMPYVDFRHIERDPKWLCGASDPTNLLFTVTTKLDIATLYGRNGAGFALKAKRPQKDFFRIVSGDLITQRSYSRYQTFLETINDVKTYSHDVKWIADRKIDVEGRLIGGCVEVIAKLIGTGFDHTNSFIDKYQDDGIIWYLDIFNQSTYDFYMTLLQFKHAGWFRNCKAVLIGRPAFPGIEDPKLDYVKAADKALGKIPHICEMDIGHTRPAMTLINGAIARVRYEDGKGQISFKLK